MTTRKTPQAATPPTLESLAAQLHALSAATADPSVAVLLGPGIVRELRYGIASFKQRFPDAWPSPQARLF